MASIRYRTNKWQARVSRKGEHPLTKTFHTKEDAERWAKSIKGVTPYLSGFAFLEDIKQPAPPHNLKD